MDSRAPKGAVQECTKTLIMEKHHWRASTFAHCLSVVVVDHEKQKIEIHCLSEQQMCIYSCMYLENDNDSQRTQREHSAATLDTRVHHYTKTGHESWREGGMQKTETPTANMGQFVCWLVCHEYHHNCLLLLAPIFPYRQNILARSTRTPSIMLTRPDCRRPVVGRGTSSVIKRAATSVKQSCSSLCTVKRHPLTLKVGSKEAELIVQSENHYHPNYFHHHHMIVRDRRKVKSHKTSYCECASGQLLRLATKWATLASFGQSLLLKGKESAHWLVKQQTEEEDDCGQMKANNQVVNGNELASNYYSGERLRAISGCDRARGGNNRPKR